ncbi:hypothetical protein N7455_000571 [Penicillium solitum]|uniref:uncharacterized protein n=1 Tax=Penicillium solitum TaxID=60172 RepID=UPI0032C467EC|nr:hypothetical protein N7536_006946 [Penicillium majusculum]KAJ5877106.1 hypothetical protein N7455_000571 [Penicillium solitum]
MVLDPKLTLKPEPEPLQCTSAHFYSNFSAATRLAGACLCRLSQVPRSIWPRLSPRQASLKVCGAGCCLYPVLALEARWFQALGICLAP